MNPNTEYERFTQEIYQQLVNLDVVRTTTVQHDVKLEGRSGQKHQIDVYWEYEIAGNKHKVAIECKNYNKLVPIGKVRDFKGVLDDLNGVNGIMVTKVGYQEGAKKYAQEYGISLKELRTPRYGETSLDRSRTTYTMRFAIPSSMSTKNGPLRTISTSNDTESVYRCYLPIGPSCGTAHLIFISKGKMTFCGMLTGMWSLI